MDQCVHAVPASVVSSLRDRTTKRTARFQWKDEEIQRVTDWARQFGIKQAIKRMQRSLMRTKFYHGLQ